jgi:hypothetical protein
VLVFEKHHPLMEKQGESKGQHTGEGEKEKLGL